MAGHSKFKNIQHRKGAQDKKRAKLFTKLVREISASIKTGQNDPEHNPRLRTAILAARAHNLPKDRIDKALLHSSSSSDNLEEIRYEGFGPGKIPVIIEAMTDNKNRTVAEVRAALGKNGGVLAESGSVAFMFDHVGLVEYFDKDFDALSTALEAGAEDVISDNDNNHTIICKKEDFGNVLHFLTNKIGIPNVASIVWKAKEEVEVLDKEVCDKLHKMLDALDDIDDVQNVYTAASNIE